jgi:hypothetical protein
MTDHDNIAADDGAQRHIATQPGQQSVKPEENESPDRVSTTATRRKALDGSQLGEPVLDWSGINVSSQRVSPPVLPPLRL